MQTATPGYYDFYTAGKINGKGPVLIMFRYYRLDGAFGSCECVEIDEAGKHREAIRALGYQSLAALDRQRARAAAQQ